MLLVLYMTLLLRRQTIEAVHDKQYLDKYDYIYMQMNWTGESHGQIVSCNFLLVMLIYYKLDHENRFSRHTTWL